MKWIDDTVTLKSGLQFKFGFALWTRRMIRTLLKERLGVDLSSASVSRLLGQLGLTCQKPLMRAFQRDPALVENWLEEEHPHTRAHAKRLPVDIFLGDEAGVRSDSHSGRTWAPRNRTPVVKLAGAPFGFNMISAVSPKGQLRFMVIQGKMATKRFWDFLRRLVFRTNRPIFLILDGHPVHRSAAARRFVTSPKGKLKLFFLSRYSPELNPDGWVRNDLKNSRLGRMSVMRADHLKQSAVDDLRQLQRTPALVRSFFEAPTTKYAA